MKISPESSKHGQSRAALPPGRANTSSTMSTTPDASPALETITLAAGCFWCVEAVLERLEGICRVTSGYMGGHTAKPSYREVCSGATGHAEVVQVQFDPRALPLQQLLEIFWLLHDPTTLNRQGADVGTQYRSAIFYHDEAQKVAAEASKKQADASGRFSAPIVTEIVPASEFHPAEDYHQSFYKLNPTNNYCRLVIPPKLKKLGLD